MNTVEITLDIAAKFDKTAQNAKGREALDWASDCVENWAEEAAAEIKRRMMIKVFENFTMDDLRELACDELNIDLNRVAWNAVQKA